MKLLKSMKKGLKNLDLSTIIVVSVCAIFVFMVYNYSSSKFFFSERFNHPLSPAELDTPSPNKEESEWAEIGDVAAEELPAAQNSIDPRDLLPKNMNGQGCEMNVSVDHGDVKGVNFLPPPTLTVERNANLTIRKDPPITQTTNVGPWNLSTIERDQFTRNQGLCS